MRNRVAIWLDANDENIKWLKEEVPPKERGKVIRKALSLYRNEAKVEADENAVIVGEAVLSQLQLAFPDRSIDDQLIQTILIRGIRNLKKEEEEKKKLEMLGVLKDV